MANVIIFGAGRGLLFARLIAEQLPEHRVAALVEIAQSAHPRLRQRLDEYGLASTAIYSTQEEALAQFPDANAVLIVTPNTTHAAYLKLCLAHGKHVLLEKPVAADWSDAAEIAHLADSTDRIVQLGFVLHYSPFYRQVKKVVESGVLGTLVNMQFNIRRDLDTEFMRGWRRLTRNTGGLLNEKSSHDLDIIRWLKRDQAEPVELFSFGGRAFFPRDPDRPSHCSQCDDAKCPFRFHAEVYDERPYNLIPDFDQLGRCVYRTDADLITDQSVLIRFSDDTHGAFNMTAISGDVDRTVILHGTTGYLSGSLKEMQLTVSDYRNNTTETIDLRSEAELADMHGGGDIPILREFFDCIATAQEPAATVADGVAATRMAFAADRSLREGRKVSLTEFPL